MLALGFVVYNYVLEDGETAVGVLPNSVAVLPFTNLSSDPDEAFFAAGIHDTVLHELAKIRDLNVIGRTSVLQYADGQTPISEIAETLNVETVLEATVQYAEGQVRITAQLIDPDTGAHLWSGNYDRPFRDIFAIQSEIAIRIAMALETELLPSEQESIERPLTESPDAYTAYLKAIAIIGEGESAFGVSASPGTRSVIQSYLDEALELDPRFALAYAWKALIYTWSRTFDPFTEENWLEGKSRLDRLVSEHADMALALDPSIGLAHAARAYMYFNNWRGEALVEADQALQLSPNDPMVLNLYSHIQSYMRDLPEEAIRYAERALELDPNSSYAFEGLGLPLHEARRHTEAIEVLQECLVLDPGESVCSIFLARSEFARGNDEAALDALRRTEQLLPGDAAPAIRGELAYGYRLLGQPEDARRAFEVVRELATNLYVDPSTWAWAYMGVGDYDEALRLLDTAAENLELLQLPWLAHFIRLNTWSDPILDQPEWVEMRSRLGFRE